VTKRFYIGKRNPHENYRIDLIATHVLNVEFVKASDGQFQVVVASDVDLMEIKATRGKPRVTMA